MLEFHRDNGLVSKNAHIENSVIVPPCFIGDHAVIRNAVIGPYVSVGHHSTVENTVITNSIIQNRSQIKNAVLDYSMVGNSSRYLGSRDELNLGDFSNFSKR
jgi:glucose-1-phosphate thymidylyltransferase